MRRYQPGGKRMDTARGWLHCPVWRVAALSCVEGGQLVRSAWGMQCPPTCRRQQQDEMADTCHAMQGQHTSHRLGTPQQVSHTESP